jgi:hypothetical protein
MEDNTTDSRDIFARPLPALTQSNLAERNGRSEMSEVEKMSACRDVFGSQSNIRTSRGQEIEKEYQSEKESESEPYN